MANTLTYARPYAKAIFELAKENGLFVAWSNLLHHLTNVVMELNVRKLITNPMIAYVDKANFLVSIGYDWTCEKEQNFIKLLALQQQLLLVPEISTLYEFYRAEEERTLDVFLLSAVKLSVAQVEKFKVSIMRVFGRKITMFCEVDGSLLGGVIVRAGDKIIDGSLRSQLRVMLDVLTTE